MQSKYPVSSKLQNSIFAWLLAWPVVAIYGDGWHHHHLDFGNENLFNAFHLFLYAGVFCAGLFIAMLAYQNIQRGYSITKSLPHMYIRAVWGIGIFFLGVVCDLVWHHFIGFEESVDALLSPPHMLLAFGGLLVVSCLLRPLWHREREKLVNPIVPVLGLMYFYLIFIFFIQYCHPYYQRWLSVGTPVFGGVSFIQAAALAGGLVRTFIFCGLLFSTLKYFKFPKGSLFAILVAEAVGIGFMGGQFQYVASAIVAGLLTELIYHSLYESLSSYSYLRMLGFLIPVAFLIPYVFVTLMYNNSWWSTHMIAGVVVVNGIVGWLLTYLVAPPKPHDHFGTN